MHDFDEETGGLRRVLRSLEDANERWLHDLGARGLYEAAALLRRRADATPAPGRFTRAGALTPARLIELAQRAEAEADRRLAEV
jgi:hypothetical protein